MQHAGVYPQLLISPAVEVRRVVEPGVPAVAWYCIRTVAPTKVRVLLLLEFCSERCEGKWRPVELPCHQNAEQSVSRLKYLVTTLTNQYLIREQIKRLNSGNAYYRSVQNLLSFRVLSKT
jgi:hypothetical protein